MSDFRPGVAAAQAAMGAKANIVHREHPGGAKGVRISLQEVADRIKKGRNDPRVVAWARQAVHAAGGPQGTRAQAAAILAALKRETSYVPDPVNTEFMASPAQILCLDKFGLCFRAADCDELVITYCSATLGVGIPTKIIGEKFNGDAVASHVLAAIQDNETGEWLRVDPSTNKPVGQYVMGTGEQWIDPMAPSGTIAGGNESGDFVGVGRIQHTGQLGATSTTPGSTTAIKVIGGAAVLFIGFLVYANVTAKPRAPIPGERRLTYRGAPFSVYPNPNSPDGKGWTLDIGDELHVGFYNDHTKKYQRFMTSEQAVRFAHIRINSDQPPRFHH